MSCVQKVISDIFSMNFDILIPISGSILAVLAGFGLFLIRYVTFRSKKRKFTGQTEAEMEYKAVAEENRHQVRAASACDSSIYSLLLNKGAKQPAGGEE